MTYISREVRHLVLSHVVRNIKPTPTLSVRGWNFGCLGILYIYREYLSSYTHTHHTHTHTHAHAHAHTPHTHTHTQLEF